MDLGFVSTVVPDLDLEATLKLAKEVGYDCVELMCWPVGKAERRYAGVTHIDVVDFTKDDARRVRALMDKYDMRVPALGYYPNPLAPDPAERAFYSEHLKKVIVAAEMLEIPIVCSFVGRDQSKTIDDNWPVFEEVWPPLIKFAEDHGISVAIENCPMLFSDDEWPGGRNLAISPEVWRRMFETISSRRFGLCFDPSHLVWQFIDIPRAVYDFGDRILHVQAKDVKVLPHLLYERGITGLKWHVPKLPGLGDTDWGAFFSALTTVGFTGAVCLEVEDRAYEQDFADRRRSLVQSHEFLRNYVV
jgi:sugar phosphate isomerase/epimerase